MTLKIALIALLSKNLSQLQTKSLYFCFKEGSSAPLLIYFIK